MILNSSDYAAARQIPYFLLIIKKLKRRFCLLFGLLLIKVELQGCQLAKNRLLQRLIHLKYESDVNRISDSQSKTIQYFLNRENDPS
jgi:hypothetical protein